MDANLVLMARRPILGQGKRRLAADIGDLAAHRFQGVALGRLLRRLGGDPRWRLFLAITPDEPLDCAGADLVIAQGEGDIGMRMTRLSEKLPAGPIVFIGSDTPDIIADDMAAAFEVLSRDDAVFGPALDGGYWLIGLSPAQRGNLPFSGVRWSTADALADTLNNLAGKRVSMLRELEDIDDGASYRRWRQRVRGSA